MPGSAFRRSWPWVLVALVAVLSLFNAWRFAERVANPIVHADSWYFLDAFAEPWEAGELGWREFFSKRGDSDHSQPLHRLSLWWNLETQQLDFRVEARLGILGLALEVGLLLGLGLAHLRRRESVQHGRWPAVLPLVLLPAMALSLNSHEIYYWSLLNFFHVSLLPALLLLGLVCWRFRPGDAQAQPAWLGPAVAALSGLVQVVLDGAGVLAVAALLPVLGWAGWRLGQARLALRLALWMLLGLVVYRAAYAALMPAVEMAQVASTSGFDYLMGHWREAGRWLLDPAAASLLHPMHLPFWVDAESVAWLRAAIAALALALHATFWWSVARDRAPAPLSLFAVALMLMVYGMVAGIVLSRLPVFGVDYLLQSRYVAFYQLANLALLLQLVVALARRRPSGAGSAMAVALIVVAGLGLQAMLSQRAWEHSQYVRQYIRDMAGNVLCLAANPGLDAPACQPGNPICETDVARRDRLIGLLRRQRLNLFAPGFLQRHDLQQGLDTASCLAAGR